jgi:hypothetical protein
MDMRNDRDTDRSSTKTINETTRLLLARVLDAFSDPGCGETRES